MEKVEKAVVRFDFCTLFHFFGLPPPSDEKWKPRGFHFSDDEKWKRFFPLLVGGEGEAEEEKGKKEGEGCVVAPSETPLPR